MSDTPLADKQIDGLIAHFEQERDEINDMVGDGVPSQGMIEWLDNQKLAFVAMNELKAAREEIARWEALPPRMAEPVIRPVYPIDERGEN